MKNFKRNRKFTKKREDKGKHSCFMFSFTPLILFRPATALRECQKAELKEN